MSQMQGGEPRRRSSGGDLDIYTALGLAGTFALIVAVIVLWVVGKDFANGELPFTLMN